MRKIIPVLMSVLLLILLCGTAQGETFVMDSIYASIDISADFPIVLRPDHLDDVAQWLEAQGKDKDAVASDFTRRNVLLQCWNEAGDMCFELTAVQNDQTKQVFDVNEQSESVRGSYRLSHYPRNEYEGYDFTSSNWKKTESGRFLVLNYARRSMGDILYRGLMRRTIRNGYEITLDLQIYDRRAVTKDTATLDKLWKTFQFVQVLTMPPAASAQINITKEPPTETNSPDFSMDGTAAEGVKLTAVVMGLSYPDPLLFETTANAAGKFKMPITLPKEGVFLITVTGEYQGEDIIELAYPVTYQRLLLTVNVTSDVPETVTMSELSILGTSEPGASIQTFVNSEPAEQKRVTSAGKFKVDFNLDEEGSYELAIVFSKKGLADRRITYAVTRQWTDDDTLKQLSREAIKPGYANLIDKMEGYEGRIMGYKAYPLTVTQSGQDWIVEMALTKNGSKYSGIILVVCHEEPNITIGQRVMMYGTCAGMSLGGTQEDSGDESKSYPCFDLLLFGELE